MGRRTAGDESQRGARRRVAVRDGVGEIDVAPPAVAQWAHECAGRHGVGCLPVRDRREQRGAHGLGERAVQVVPRDDLLQQFLPSGRQLLERGRVERGLRGTHLFAEGEDVADGAVVEVVDGRGRGGGLAERGDLTGSIALTGGTCGCGEFLAHRDEVGRVAAV